MKSRGRRLTIAEHKARREDVTWMAESGETLEGAAKRLGLSRGGLAKWLDSVDLSHLKEQMAAREFHEANGNPAKHHNRIYARPRRTAA